MSAVVPRIHRVTAEDWREVRDLRLEMLADTPLAFLEHLADAEKLDDEAWRRRVARRLTDRAVTLAAITPQGRWVGTMGAHAPADGSGPWLVGVYVSPRFRGSRHGVTDALLDAVEEWAAERADRLLLEVHESNPRARAFYARRGYIETGRTLPYPLDTTQRELEMLKRLERTTAR